MSHRILVTGVWIVLSATCASPLVGQTVAAASVAGEEVRVWPRAKYKHARKFKSAYDLASDRTNVLVTVTEAGFLLSIAAGVLQDWYLHGVQAGFSFPGRQLQEWPDSVALTFTMRLPTPRPTDPNVSVADAMTQALAEPSGPGADAAPVAQIVLASETGGRVPLEGRVGAVQQRHVVYSTAMPVRSFLALITDSIVIGTIVPYIGGVEKRNDFTFKKKEIETLRDLASRMAVEGKVPGAALAVAAVASNSSEEPAATAEPDATPVPSDPFSAGFAAYAAERWDEAVGFYQEAVNLNPYYREALFNLALAYQQRSQHDKVVPLGHRLVALAPNGADNWLLLAQAYYGLAEQAQGNPAKQRVLNDSLDKYAKKWESLPATLTMTSVTLSGPAIGFTAEMENRTATEKTYRVLVELLDISGNVVATKEVTVGPIPPKGKTEFEVTRAAVNVAAIRYKLR